MQTRQRIADLLADFSNSDVEAVADFCAYLQYRSTKRMEKQAETMAELPPDDGSGLDPPREEQP